MGENGSCTPKAVLSRSGVLTSLLLSLAPSSPASGQGWAAYVQGGVTGGPRGSALVSVIGAELGLTERVRASARYLDRSRRLCAEDASCPAEATGLEMGLGLSLGGGPRLAPFTQLLVGFSRERDYIAGGTDPFFSASVLIGVDLHVAPPLILRLAAAHQEIPRGPFRWSSHGRNTGLFVGLGLTGGVRASDP